MRLCVTLVAVGGLGAVLAGCANYSGIDRDLKEMSDQLNQVSTEVGAMRTSLDSATELTRQAQHNAAAAEFTANEALTLAASDRKSVTELNEKLDRLDHQDHQAHQPHRHSTASSSASSSSSSSVSPSSPAPAADD
jgi:outer membrane murein-binding lipoprotein Lpp